MYVSYDIITPINIANLRIIVKHLLLFYLLWILDLQLQQNKIDIASKETECMIGSKHSDDWPIGIVPYVEHHTF